MAQHGDTGVQCLMGHADESEGGCIHCKCGRYVRPHHWEAHLNDEDVPTTPAPYLPPHHYPAEIAKMKGPSDA